MSEKPSLYVVEKREVVILVVLFVLVTVLSFTLGVRYGETVGRKAAREQQSAEAEHGTEAAESIGGTLGKATETPDTHGASGHETGGGDHKDAAAAHAPSEHGKEVHAEDEGEAHSPEAAAKAPARAGTVSPKEPTDKSSDEYLLNALKESGVEPPGGKAPKEAKLPEDVKKAQSGSYVVQVGSHPTRSEAEAQVRQLKGKRVSAEILAPFKDRQGEWHRVVVGSFKSKRDAEREAGALKGRGAILSYFVWRLP